MSAAFAGVRATRSRSFEVPLPAAEALRLFEPEGERGWAPGWDPRYVYPAGGGTEAGMVFTTAQDHEATTWIVTRHDAKAGVVEYVRITSGSRVATVLVQCAALDERRTRVTVTYVFTGLSEQGNAYVQAMDEAHYREFIGSWETAICERYASGPAGEARKR